jgi:hypothetical protein
MIINERQVKKGAPVSFVTFDRLVGNSVGAEKLGK